MDYFIVMRLYINYSSANYININIKINEIYAIRGLHFL